MEMCLRRISSDHVSFRDRWCGFSPSSLVAPLVCWSFGVLARRLPFVYFNKFYHDKLRMTPVMEGEDGSKPSSRATVCSRR
jgi:hypothetical protein